MAIPHPPKAVFVLGLQPFGLPLPALKAHFSLEKKCIYVCLDLSYNWAMVEGKSINSQKSHKTVTRISCLFFKLLLVEYNIMRYVAITI